MSVINQHIKHWLASLEIKAAATHGAERHAAHHRNTRRAIVEISEVIREQLPLMGLNPALADNLLRGEPVQVNGKLRGTFEMARDSNAQSVESTALALAQVARWPETNPPRKIVVVPKPDRQHRRVRTPSLNGRGLLRGAIAGVALALASCGWAPLNADIEAGPATEELRAIRVDPIPERLGQRLRMALRNSFNPSGEPARQRYILRVTPSVGLSNLGIQAQGLGTLGQLDISVTYSLVDMESGKTLLTNTTHVANSFDLNPNQYSTVVGEDDAAVRSVVELNQEIVTRLTLFMQRRIAEKSSKPS